ncbi:MAG: molybdopterin molybdotransferase MoeA [Clostridium fessum]
MKLLKVDTLAQARERLLEAAKECLPETERVALADASGCILAEDIVSGEMIPAFRRSSVDGYAVCSKDTAGATESIPVFLKVLEEVEIGHPAVSKIEPGTCAYVPTGGMVPEGADAMVMVEYSERFGTDEVALYENVPYGKCIVLPGEDVKTGDIVLKAGTRIGPAQAGTLAALGVVQVPVFKPWKVAVLSTGDELVRIDQVPGPGQVRDINTGRCPVM